MPFEQCQADRSAAPPRRLKGEKKLVRVDKINHSYPFCWRSDTPLIYRAVPGTFINVEAIKDRLLANNAQTYWVPAFVKEKRFHNWLENARDWAVRRGAAAASSLGLLAPPPSPRPLPPPGEPQPLLGHPDPDVDLGRRRGDGGQI